MSNESVNEDEAAEAARRRRVLWITLILLIGLPIYLITAAFIIGYLTAPTATADGTAAVKPLHWLVELAIYVVLGLVWAFPLKGLVQGVGKKPGG